LGVLPLTTTSNEKRIVEYLNIFDFEMSPEEIQEIIDIKDKKFFRGWMHQFYPETADECNAGL